MGRVFVVLAILLLAAVSAFFPVVANGNNTIAWERGLHNRMMDGRLGFPFSHRIAVFYLADFFLHLGVEFVWALLAVRFIAGIVLFSGVYLLCNKSILAIAITYLSMLVPSLASNGSAMFLSLTIIDVGLIALGLYFYRNNRLIALIPIMLLGIINRETVIALPAVLLIDHLYRGAKNHKNTIIILISLAIGVVGYTILHRAFPGAYREPVSPGVFAGWSAVRYNLSVQSLVMLLVSFGILPFIVNVRKLGIIEVLLSVVFIGATLWAGNLVETRLMLYPVLLVALPQIVK